MLYSAAEHRSTERNISLASPHTPPRSAEPGRLSSVAASVRLLKAFSEEQVEIGISDLARRLGVAKSTVHRLAVTLVADGMLEQNPDTGKYRLGLSLFRLGSLVRQRMNVSNEGRTLLRELREKVNETVHLAVLDGAEIMYVFNLESTQAIRMRSDIGVRKPAHRPPPHAARRGPRGRRPRVRVCVRAGGGARRGPRAGARTAAGRPPPPAPGGAGPPRPAGGAVGGL